ncbi:YjbF family lipoprotein (plasmid) [Rhodobacteraceae bacterium M382]|nr:YjbF family lipoprotein [Rhodobacteraceae bacterium M382]
MRFVLSVAVLLTVLGCSRGTEEAPLQEQVVRNIGNVIRARTQPDPGLPPVTRAQLDALDGGALEATVENRGLSAYLSVNATRDDGAGGHVTVWRTGDDATLTTRNGILVATRGLGADILSSDVRVSGDQPGPVGGGSHVQLIRGGDEQALRLSLICEISDKGSQTLEIVGRRHVTRHVQQSCTGAGGAITNDYWVDPRANVVWQSRQWAGPEIGYIRLRRLSL